MTRSLKGICLKAQGLRVRELPWDAGRWERLNLEEVVASILAHGLPGLIGYGQNRHIHRAQLLSELMDSSRCG